MAAIPHAHRCWRVAVATTAVVQARVRGVPRRRSALVRAAFSTAPPRGHSHTPTWRAVAPPPRHAATARRAAHTVAVGDPVPREWIGTTTPPPGDAVSHSAFVELALSSPDSIAVTFRDESITYAKLLRSAQALAVRLTTRDAVTRGDVVGVLLERGIDAIVAAVAVSLAGGVYLPLDEHYPPARTRFCFDDSKCAVLIAHEHLVESLLPDVAAAAATPAEYGSTAAARATSAPRLVSVKRGEPLVRDEETDALIGQNGGTTLPDVRPSDGAYIVYTSGSTGTPKGILATHTNTVALTSAATQFMDLPTKRAWLGSTPASFDIAQLELWGALSNGMTLAATTYCDLADPWYNEVLSVIQAHNVDVVHAVPAVWQALINAGLAESSSLLGVSVGEPLTPALATQMMKVCGKVQNGYGPSETNYCTVHTVTQADIEKAQKGEAMGIPIGKPLLHQAAYVVKPDGSGELAAVGERGELIVGGAAVAAGYVGRPERTTQAFRPNPFGDAGRVYATGDTVAWRTDGVLEFVGRRDTQMNILGLRVEPGEVELPLAQIDGVQAVAVVQHGDEIAAFIVVTDANESGVLAVDGASIDMEALSVIGEKLLRELPPYHVPTLWAAMRASDVPLTPSGKIDKLALARRAAGGGDITLTPYSAFDPAAAAATT